MKVNNNGISNSLHKIGNHKTDRLEDLADSKSSSVSKGENLEESAKINLSDRAQAMSKANEIASEQTVDEAKVARLQKMIDEGRYNVDASAIADQLVDEHLMMPE